MPTISSRPEAISLDSDDEYLPDEIAAMIADAVLYVMPNDTVELKLTLHVACRVLLKASIIDDFYVHTSSFKPGYDVGFKLHSDIYYHVIQIN